MNVGTKLALYGAGLVAAFFAAFFLAGAIVPESLVQSWIEQSESNTHDEHGGEHE